MTATETEKAPATKRVPGWLAVVFPLILLGGLIYLFITTNPVQVATSELPPVENLNVQRVIVTETGFELRVTNSGPDAIKISQIQVDDAYWQYSISPGRVLNRLDSAVITIEYPWVETEPHAIAIITSSGTVFEAEVPLATLTPTLDAGKFWAYALVGLYVGILPVGLGLLWYPAMRRLKREGMGFLLSLTIGLLIFLLVDTFLESFEVAAELPGIFQGLPLTIFMALLTWLAITAIGNRKSVADRTTTQGRLFVAMMIAIGIGFHNLGEGLVVGAAFALGEAALGSFLVIGFILHNITEGIGIAAPVTRENPGVRWFLWMLLISGGPAIAGTLIGGFAFSPLLAVIFLGIGAGAIWQVVYEVGMMLRRDAERAGAPLVTWLNVAGLLAGIAIMYFTAFLVK